MTYVKTEPFAGFKTFQDDFSRVFGDACAGIFDNVQVNTWAPRVDVYEDDNVIKLVADLPGVSPDAFKLSIENFKLTLSGERKFEGEEQKDKWHRVERRYGAFERTFTLPRTVDVEGVKAVFKEGVLTVTLPKREDVKPRTINVEVKTV